MIHLHCRESYYRITSNHPVAEEEGKYTSYGEDQPED